MSGGVFVSGWQLMETVIFVGLPGAGKSSFCKERFFNTHVRISLDLLRTRHREQRLMQVCLETGQRLVIDNTNPTRQERAVYIQPAMLRRFTITGYYFQAKVADCLRRNTLRPEGQRVPDVAILSAAKKLEIPSVQEGFDKLWYVRLSVDGFVVEEWRDDI